MAHSVLVALAACVAGAALEGICAGPGVKQRFSELRMPRFSPPLAAWIVIGVAYYVICFAVIRRLLVLPASRMRSACLALVTVVLVANAFWNFVFFRVRSVRSAFATTIVYSVAALCLLVLLLSFDAIAGRWFLPYAGYLAYANAWGCALVRANSQRG